MNYDQKIAVCRLLYYQNLPYTFFILYICSFFICCAFYSIRAAAIGTNIITNKEINGEEKGKQWNECPSEHTNDRNSLQIALCTLFSDNECFDFPIHKPRYKFFAISSNLDCRRQESQSSGQGALKTALRCSRSERSSSSQDRYFDAWAEFSMGRTFWNRRTKCCGCAVFCLFLASSIEVKDFLSDYLKYGKWLM